LRLAEHNQIGTKMLVLLEDTFVQFYLIYNLYYYNLLFLYYLYYLYHLYKYIYIYICIFTFDILLLWYIDVHKNSYHLSVLHENIPT
jgi:hypothetical protein